MPGSRVNNKVDFSSSWEIIWAPIRRGELVHNFTVIFIPSIFIGTNITRSQAHRAEGKQGKITARDLQAQRNTSSCLTLIMACIIY